MKRTIRRRWGVVLALACLASMPAVRAPLLLAALAFEHPLGGHSFSLLLAADASHFDLILSHADEPAPPDSRPHRDGDSGSCSEADHVVHLCADPAIGKSERRAVAAAAVTRRISELPLPAVGPGRSSIPSSHLGLRAADGLRSVVIRC